MININPGKKQTLLSIYLGLVFVCFDATVISCRKLVEVNAPSTSINGGNVYNSDATAEAVLTGVYTNMSASGLIAQGFTSTSLYAGLSADELDLYTGATGGAIQYYTNALTNTTTPNLWTSAYQTIFILNSAIEGVGASTSLTPVVKQQLLGEAKFLRAFSYFYLVGLYGDVPLAISSNYEVNGSLSRTASKKVWAQIIADLKDAENELSQTYLSPTLLTGTSERVRPTSWAATALLARAYLYTSDWTDAASQASSVIANTSLFVMSSIDSLFYKNNPEAIWQLQPVNAGWNTEDARVFIIPSTGPSTNYPVFLSKSLLNAFEPGDLRRYHWVDSVMAGGVMYYYPYKYKSATLNAQVKEYEMVLRLAEQYLIRAEAKAQLGDISGSVADLNLIRSRGKLTPISSSVSQAQLLPIIQHERQIELFSEWGHRWLDLKRTSQVDAVMKNVSPLKWNQTWNTQWQWYPLPIGDLNADVNLFQNPGY